MQSYTVKKSYLMHQSYSCISFKLVTIRYFTWKEAFVILQVLDFICIFVDESFPVFLSHPYFNTIAIFILGGRILLKLGTALKYVI